IESRWDTDCKQFPGRYNLLKKLYYMAKHLRIWNREHYGNQDSRLGVLDGKIEDFESIQESRVLTSEEANSLGDLNRERKSRNRLNTIPYHGNSYSTFTEIKGAATGYYSQLFTNHTTTRPLMGPEGFQRLSPDKAAMLERG
ncbi:hypothetical protein H0E87_031213, partial [Populus deltoides]